MDDGWTDVVEEGRKLFANLIGAKPENIAYSFGNSVAFSSIMSAFQFSHSDNIIFNDQDFPALPAGIMAHQDFGLRYKVVGSKDGFVEVDDYEREIDVNTKLITGCEVASNTGSRLNVDHLVEISHQRDIPVFLDTYQSTGVIPLNVKKLDIDFLASGCLKWLVGGFGISFMYIRDDWIERMNPASIGWMGVEDPFADLFDKLRTTLHRPINATKFQFGTPYPVGAMSAVAGMRLINNIGIREIYNYDMKITDMIIEEANKRDIGVLTPVEKQKRGSIVNLQVANSSKVVKELQNEEFILDMRSNGIRVAPHFYNNDEDVYRLFEKIDDLIQ